jgi:tetratricopeptide (TPR) repeat protein
MQRFPVSRIVLASAAAVALCIGAPRAEVSRSQEVRARVFKMLNDGIQAVKEGRPKDAIPLLDQASRIALNSFRAYFYLGVAYKDDRQYLKAVEPLQVALELDPVNLQARVTLGDCYLKRGDPAEALAEYHRALEQQSDYAPALDGLARAAETAGDVEKAVEHYRKAIAVNPGFPDASMNLGDLLLREGRDNEAIDLFLQAIRVRPDFAAAYNRLGAAYAHQRLHNEAIAALRKAELLEKGNPWHPVTIGAIFQELDNLVQARREFDKALALDADYLDGYLARARLLRRQELLDEALAALDAGLARPVDDPRAQSRLRELKETVGGELARLAGLATRLESGERSRDLLAARAELRAGIGNHAGAVEDLREALSVPDTGSGPADAVVLGRLAVSALRAGLYEDAARACTQLLAARPGDPDVLINLGLARTGTGDGAGAESALRAAIQARPGDPRPHAYLANLYVLEGRREQAAQALRASLGLMQEGAQERQRVERLLRALGQPPAAAPGAGS